MITVFAYGFLFHIILIHHFYAFLLYFLPSTYYTYSMNFTFLLFP